MLISFMGGFCEECIPVMQSLTQPSPSREGFWLLSPAGEGLGMRVLPGEPWESAKVGCTLCELVEGAWQGPDTVY